MQKAAFLFGGNHENDRTLHVPVVHVDVLVGGWAGSAPVSWAMPLKAGVHPITGACRLNLTFRNAY